MLDVIERCWVYPCMGMDYLYPVWCVGRVGRWHYLIFGSDTYWQDYLNWGNLSIDAGTWFFRSWDMGSRYRKSWRVDLNYVDFLFSLKVALSDDVVDSSYA